MRDGSSRARRCPRPAGELRLRAKATIGCPVDTEGRYAWTRSTDGLFLTLDLIEDGCPARATSLARTWTRSLGAVNDGRHGVINYFSPAIQVVLPEGRWAAGGAFEGADISEDSGLNIIAVKNPAGLSDPCSTDGGNHVAIDPTIATFSDYLGSIPGFTLAPTALEIDGHEAVHLAITTSADVGCEKIFEWATSDLSDSHNWFITPGDPDSLWLVQVDADLYLIAYLGPRVTLADQEAVMSSIRFVDELPTP